MRRQMAPDGRSAVARWASALAAAALAATGIAHAETVERIAAVINDDVILLSRLEDRATPVIAAAAQQSASLSQQLGEEDRQRLLKRVLMEMVDENLVEEQASKMQIRITTAEVDRALKNMAAQNNLAWPDFVRAIEGQGYSLAQYRQDLHRQLMRFKVVQNKLASRLRVTDQEVKTYYTRQVRRARAGDRCRLSHIVVGVQPDDGAAKVSQRRRRAKAILARAEQGVSFAALAERYSDDASSAKNGGSLGWVDSGDLPAELRDVVLGLGAGEMGGPVRTDDGFRVVKVLEWEASDVRPFGEAREEIKLRLLEKQLEQQERVWLTELRRKAYIDVRLWRD
jgi:peptidyl-prolyl cis-trans isomerase SurA